MDLAVILPVHNEKETLLAVVAELSETIAKLSQLPNRRIVVVDDCSDDGCIALLKGWWRDNAPATTTLTIVSLTSKHGLFRSLLKGLKLVASYNPRYTLIMDADGQDNPHVVTQLLAEDSDIVFASRGKRSESLFFRFGYQALQLFLRIFTANEARQGHFCLLKPAVVSYLAELGDIDYLGAKLATSGFQQKSIVVDRRPRLAGTTKFSVWGHCQTALIIISYSNRLLVNLHLVLFGLLFLVVIFADSWLVAISAVIYLLSAHNLLSILANRANSRRYQFDERVENFDS